MSLPAPVFRIDRHGFRTIHECLEVSGYPAAHGRVRLPGVEAPTVWHFGCIGMSVWVAS